MGLKPVKSQILAFPEGQRAVVADQRTEGWQERLLPTLTAVLGLHNYSTIIYTQVCIIEVLFLIYCKTSHVCKNTKLNFWEKICKRSKSPLAELKPISYFKAYFLHQISWTYLFFQSEDEVPMLWAWTKKGRHGQVSDTVLGSMWKVHYCVFKSNFKMQMHWLTILVSKTGNFLALCSFIFHKEWNTGQSFICWRLATVTQTQHWPKFFLLRSAGVENNEGSVVSQMQNFILLECLQV